MIYLDALIMLCLICAVVDRCKAYSDLKAKYDTMVIEKNAELKRVRDRLAESIKETNDAIESYSKYHKGYCELYRKLDNVRNIVQDNT